MLKTTLELSAVASTGVMAGLEPGEYIPKNFSLFPCASTPLASEPRISFAIHIPFEKGNPLGLVSRRGGMPGLGLCQPLLLPINLTRSGICKSLSASTYRWQTWPR